MRSTQVLYGPNTLNKDIISRINWIRASGRYVIINPEDNNLLLYLSEREYNKLVVSALNQDKVIITLVTPDDTVDSVKTKFTSDSSTPNFSFLIARNHRLISIIPGWKIKDSMIEFERNFEYFIPYYYRDIITWLGISDSQTSRKAMKALSKKLTNYFSFRGINNTILVMKITSIVVLKYLGGEKLTDTQSLGQRIKLTNGLPVLLPSHLRRLIRSRNLPMIRVIMTLLYAYKGFKGKWGKPDISSITAPAFYLYERFEHELYSTRDKFFKEFTSKEMKLEFSQPPLILTAGPNSNPSISGVLLDAFYHISDPNKNLIRFCLEFNKLRKEKGWFIPPLKHIDRIQEDFWKLYDSTLLVKDMIKYPFIKRLTRTYRNLNRDLNAQFPRDLFEKVFKNIKAAKLSIKLEAAGKVRVFAIVDYFTQWALKPLHDDMFNILKGHESDATFDQTGVVSKFSQYGYRTCYSYDLKSATDLIPSQLYKIVLGSRYSDELMSRWYNLLTDRDYYFSAQTKTTPKGHSFRYTRGQPMGALSSWAALAIIHHYLVFLAAHRLGKHYSKFRDYIVLGDDIVIFDKDVAYSYLEVCNDFGISIGLPKSFVSQTGLFQFASQDVLGGDYITPLPLKDALASSMNSHLFNKYHLLFNRIQFAIRMNKLGYVSDSLINLIRGQCTAYQWSEIKKLFQKGIVPDWVRDILVVTLIHQLNKDGYKVENLDRLIAAIAGDYRLICSPYLRYSKEERSKVLVALYQNLFSDISKVTKKLDSNFENFSNLIKDPFGPVTSFLIEVVLRVRTINNGRNYYDLKLKYNEDLYRARFAHRDLGSSSFTKLIGSHDIVDLEGAHLYTLVNLITYKEELDSFATNFSLTRKVLSRLSNGKPSYFLRFQLSESKELDIKKILKWS